MLPSYPESTRRSFARNLLRNALRIKRGENVLIETWSATLEWGLSLSLEAKILGARPLLSLKDEASYWRSLTEGPASQFARIGEHEWAALRASDAFVWLSGPMDAAREEALPRAAIRRWESNTHELMRVIQKYGVRSVRWDLGRTSEFWARRYGIELRQWRRELIDAAMVDPRGMQREGNLVAGRLRKGRDATISHPNGTHLTLRLAHRPPKVDDGIIDTEDVRAGNVMLVVPAGVSSVSVSELHAEGAFVSNSTGVLFVEGHEVPLTPGRWTFRHGCLDGYDQTAGGRRLRRELRRLGNPRIRAGQLSVGLNPRISTIPLLFDQARGTITFEMGRNVHLGGRSRSPNLQAYVDLQGGNLEIDGDLVVDRGHLVTA
jgi:leucyl aminopeptidase (aminopeptidase T)